MGSGGIVPHTLNLGSGWRWVMSFTLRLCYLEGKYLRCYLGRRLHRPRADVDAITRSSCICRESNPGRPVLNVLTILTELSLLPLVPRLFHTSSDKFYAISVQYKHQFRGSQTDSNKFHFPGSVQADTEMMLWMQSLPISPPFLQIHHSQSSTTYSCVVTGS
jgi:hypothetical protein